MLAFVDYRKTCPCVGTRRATLAQALALPLYSAESWFWQGGGNVATILGQKFEHVTGATVSMRWTTVACRVVSSEV